MATKKEAVNNKIKMLQNDISYLQSVIDKKEKKISECRKTLRDIKNGSYKPTLLDKFMYTKEEVVEEKEPVKKEVKAKAEKKPAKKATSKKKPVAKKATTKKTDAKKAAVRKIKKAAKKSSKK